MPLSQTTGFFNLEANHEDVGNMFLRLVSIRPEDYRLHNNPAGHNVNTLSAVSYQVSSNFDTIHS